MLMQSHILAPPFSSSFKIIPFNLIPNSSVLHSILESSFLTMILKHHHIHAISKIHGVFWSWKYIKDNLQKISRVMEALINNVQ